MALKPRFLFCMALLICHAGLLSSNAQAQDTRGIRQIYCLPISLDSYRPISIETIQGYACPTVDARLLASVWEGLEAAGRSGRPSGGFKDGLVRVALLDGDVKIYIDAQMQGVRLDRSGRKYFGVPPGSRLARLVQTAFDNVEAWAAVQKHAPER